MRRVRRGARSIRPFIRLPSDETNEMQLWPGGWLLADRVGLRPESDHLELSMCHVSMYVLMNIWWELS
jgi:hypothetical protein